MAVSVDSSHAVSKLLLFYLQQKCIFRRFLFGAFAQNRIVSLFSSIRFQESLNNLGVLESKREKKAEARDLFTSAQVSRRCLVDSDVLLTLLLNLQDFAPHNYEPCYNIALLANKAGQYQVRRCHSALRPLRIMVRISFSVLFKESYRNLEKALALYPQHTESNEMLVALKKKLAR